MKSRYSILFVWKVNRGKFDRKDILIALGGGVVGDLTGYVAATYLRKFLYKCHHTISMVDSSIGGKTGVDFKGFKNMIGPFITKCCIYQC